MTRILLVQFLSIELMNIFGTFHFVLSNYVITKVKSVFDDDAT